MPTVGQTRRDFDYLDAHVSKTGWNRDHVARFIRDHDRTTPGANMATLTRAAAAVGIGLDLLAAGIQRLLRQERRTAAALAAKTSTLTVGRIQRWQ